MDGVDCSRRHCGRRYQWSRFDSDAVAVNYSGLADETISLTSDLARSSPILELNDRKPYVEGPKTLAQEAVDRVIGQILGGARKIIENKPLQNLMARALSRQRKVILVGTNAHAGREYSIASVDMMARIDWEQEGLTQLQATQNDVLAAGSRWQARSSTA